MINVGIMDTEGQTLELLEKIISAVGVNSMPCSVSYTDLLKSINDNIVFDLIVVLDQAGQECIPLTHNQVKEGVTVVVNSDAGRRCLCCGVPARFITYGLDCRATVTSSSITVPLLDSVQKQDIICCIQREFITKHAKCVEPQEFKITCTDKKNIYSVLAAVTASILCGVRIDLLTQVEF